VQPWNAKKRGVSRDISIGLGKSTRKEEIEAGERARDQNSSIGKEAGKGLDV